MSDRIEIKDDGYSVVIKPQGKGQVRLFVNDTDSITQKTIAAIRQQQADIEALHKDLKVADDQIAKLNSVVCGDMSREAYIDALCVRNGEMMLSAHGDGVSMLTQSIVEMYRAGGGENYVEMSMQDRKTGEHFTLTVQRNEGKSPHMFRAEAEKERDKLRAKLAEIERAPTVAHIGTELIARPIIGDEK